MSPESGEPTQWIAEARLSLQQTRALLLEPTARNVGIAATALSQAIGRIQALQCRIASRGPLNAREQESARALRDGVASAAELLRQAAAYHTRLLQSMMDADRAAAPRRSPTGLGRGVQLHA